MTLIPQTVVALSKFDIDGNKNIVEGAAFSVSFSDPGMPEAVVIYSTREGEILDPPYLTNSAGIFNFYINPGQYNYGINGTYYKVDVVDSSLESLIDAATADPVAIGDLVELGVLANTFDILKALNMAYYEIITKTGTDELIDYTGVFLKCVRMTNASAKTLTVEAYSVSGTATGEIFNIRNVGAGLLTIVADSGVTINPPAGGTLTVAQSGSVTLMCVAEDEYDLIGQVVTV